MLTPKQALKIWGKIVDILAKKEVYPIHCILRATHEGEDIVMEFDPFQQALDVRKEKK